MAIPMLWGLWGQGIDIKKTIRATFARCSSHSCQIYIITSNCHVNVLKYRIFLAKVQEFFSKRALRLLQKGIYYMGKKAFITLT